MAASSPTRSLALAAAALALALGGCDRVKTAAGKAAPATFDQARLEAQIDANFGGVGTCVVIADTRSGRTVYRYGSHTLCMRQLPPCASFDIANGLIALDAGKATPETVLKWDRSPQPTSAWERDADMKTAFQDSIDWWWRSLARSLGRDAYAQRLAAFDYGSEKPEGTADAFWMGPAAGGRLLISTEQQATFLHRLFADRLPVKPGSAAAITAMMVDTSYEASTMSGKAGTCASVADQGRQVAWWVGRVQSAPNDVVFAISLEGANDDVLPGGELARRARSAFTAAGLWPRASG